MINIGLHETIYDQATLKLMLMENQDKSDVYTSWVAALGNWEERYAIIRDYDVTAAEARIYAAD